MAENLKAWDKAVRKGLKAMYDSKKQVAFYLCMGMTGSRELSESMTIQAIQLTMEDLTPGILVDQDTLSGMYLKNVLELCRGTEVDNSHPDALLPFWSGLEPQQKELFVLRYLIELNHKEASVVLRQSTRKVAGACTALDTQLGQLIQQAHGVDCGYGAAIPIHIRQQIMLEQDRITCPQQMDKEATALLSAPRHTGEGGGKKRLLLPVAVVCVLALVAGVLFYRLGGGTSSITPEYYAEIVIADYGTITVALDAEAAPETVANFVALAEEGFYDGLTFHRIIEGFMMQGGDPNGDGTGGSENTITGEFSDNGYENNLSHTRGAISMARSTAYDSASSQFFIVQEDSTYLDGSYACFGYVVDGMDIVDLICEQAEPTDDNGTIASEAQPVITTITIYTADEYSE